MLQRNNRWPASVLGVMLYTLVFIFAHHFWSAAATQAVRGQPELLLFLLPHYIREGKSYLTLAFGCTGGQHRSVMIAEEMQRRLAEKGFQTKTSHRDAPQ